VNITEVIRECTTEEEQTKLQLSRVPDRWSKLHGNEEMCTRTRLAPRIRQDKRRNGAAKLFEFYIEMRRTLYRTSTQKCRHSECKHLLNTT